MAFFLCNGNGNFTKYTTDLKITSSSHTFSLVESYALTGIKLKSWGSQTSTGVGASRPATENYTVTFKLVGVDSGTVYSTLTYQRTSTVTYLSAYDWYLMSYSNSLNPAEAFTLPTKVTEQLKLVASGKMATSWNFVVALEYAFFKRG